MVLNHYSIQSIQHASYYILLNCNNSTWPRFLCPGLPKNFANIFHKTYLCWEDYVTSASVSRRRCGHNGETSKRNLQPLVLFLVLLIPFPLLPPFLFFNYSRYFHFSTPRLPLLLPLPRLNPFPLLRNLFPKRPNLRELQKTHLPPYPHRRTNGRRLSWHT